MYRRHWYEFLFEVGLILVTGLLTYMMYRSFLGVSKLTALIVGSLSMVGIGLCVRYAHRLRVMHIESLPLEEQAAVAWRLVRRGLLASVFGILAAGFGFLAIYLIWQEAILLGLISIGTGLALSLLALLVVKRGWPGASGPN